MHVKSWSCSEYITLSDNAIMTLKLCWHGAKVSFANVVWISATCWISIYDDVASIGNHRKRSNLRPKCVHNFWFAGCYQPLISLLKVGACWNITSSFWVRVRGQQKLILKSFSFVKDLFLIKKNGEMGIWWYNVWTKSFLEPKRIL